MTIPIRETVVLVVGARHGSLGYHVATEVSKMNVPAYAAGLYTEPINLDANDKLRAYEVFDSIKPTHVVCTVGRNIGLPVYGEDWIENAEDLMTTNYLAPMKLLAAYEEHLDGMPGTFVAISSNSAHIPRSSSAAYCASKAALSMGLRCAARDMTRGGKPLRVWGYEPGALLGTPMTREVRQRLGKGVPMSRMLSWAEGMPTMDVAQIIARDLMMDSDVLHGCMVRIDNGEL